MQLELTDNETALILLALSHRLTHMRAIANDHPDEIYFIEQCHESKALYDKITGTYDNGK